MFLISENLLNTISLIYFSLVVCFQGSYLLNKLGALFYNAIQRR